jgi:hypothetical protein
MIEEESENKVPRYFVKISNAYFMSAVKYYNQEYAKKHKKEEENIDNDKTH